MPQTTESQVPKPTSEVPKLEEAARYLRVSEADVVGLATRDALPGRKIVLKLTEGVKDPAEPGGFPAFRRGPPGELDLL